MSSQTESEREANALRLPAVLDLTVAGALKEQLEAALAASSSVCVDASGVQRVTTPCLQVLVAAARGVGEAGRPSIRLKALSPAMLEVIELLGVKKALGLYEE